MTQRNFVGCQNLKEVMESLVNTIFKAEKRGGRYFCNTAENENYFKSERREHKVNFCY